MALKISCIGCCDEKELDINKEREYGCELDLNNSTIMFMRRNNGNACECHDSGLYYLHTNLTTLETTDKNKKDIILEKFKNNNISPEKFTYNICTSCVFMVSLYVHNHYMNIETDITINTHLINPTTRINYRINVLKYFNKELNCKVIRKEFFNKIKSIMNSYIKLQKNIETLNSEIMFYKDKLELVTNMLKLSENIAKLNEEKIKILISDNIEINNELLEFSYFRHKVMDNMKYIENYVFERDDEFLEKRKFNLSIDNLKEEDKKIVNNFNKLTKKYDSEINNLTNEFEKLSNATEIFFCIFIFYIIFHFVGLN